MTIQATFSLKARNPDVLTCIANLSNDEVFTPPEFVNQMLDSIAAAWAESHHGEDIWADKSVRFLDPFTKSGVFLREITSRLTQGLQVEIPDLQERVDHVLTQQVFGIAITQLTSLLARRSLYCSKFATGPHSIASSFSSDDGNIWFKRMEHTWVGGTEWVLTTDEAGKRIKKPKDGKCKYCGAGQKALDRGDNLESHAYAFIHTEDVRELVDEMFGDEMQFDVIIGNPPYQLDDGGHGKSAGSIYHLFVDQAKKLNPRFLSMIIPSRWFTGGKGLDSFRESMLKDARIRRIEDYLVASEVFPGTDFKGGICYFLWDRDATGPCEINTHFKDWPVSNSRRPLLEEGVDVFIRFNEGLSILEKVVAVETGDSASLLLPDEKRFNRLVSSRKPFGLGTTFKGKAKKRSGDVLVYQNGGTGYLVKSSIRIGHNFVDSWKVYIGRAGPGNDSYPHMILSTPFVGEPESISSETYLCIGPLNSEIEAESVVSYLSCRLTRLLVLLHKPSQDATRKVYTFVPLQNWNRIWTDEALYTKYDISADEQAFIEKIVRPMEISGD